MANNTTNLTAPNGTDSGWLNLVLEVKENFRKIEYVPYCFIIVVGTLANLTILCNGARKLNQLKHSSNYFVLSLAMADLGVVLFSLPINIVEYTTGLNISQFTCAFVIPIRETFHCATMQSIAILALVRVKQIVKYPHVSISKRSCLMMVAVIWLNSYLLISLPFGFIFKIFPKLGTCEPVYTNRTIQRVHLTFTSAMLLLPMVVATVSYSTIIRKLKNTLNVSSSEEERTSRKSRNLSILLCLLITVSWISFVPLAIFTLCTIYEVIDATRYLVTFSFIGICYYSSSAINPILVLILTREYRFTLPRRKNRVGTLKVNRQVVVREENQLEEIGNKKNVE